ncbi:hypothetical protein CFIO01_11893 [Colletotrichum fioriniae PJ7]|uniref:Uncharacterized protein n=1 Tax=Colletotrichum fioriniae PJ7 TaxID=1445577 RepID=A0A010R3G7_9PEZI|nr:hypothetical protein CFIO01_11893 [Colletotrichum fioriniae PJ7]
MSGKSLEYCVATPELAQDYVEQMNRGFLARFQQPQEAEPQAQPGKTRILDGNHPPGPLHYSLTAPPSKVSSNTLASTSHDTTSPHKPKATTILFNVVYATRPTPDCTTVYVTTDTNLVRSQIPSVPREPPCLVSPRSAPPAATPETNTPLLLRPSAPSAFLPV